MLVKRSSKNQIAIPKAVLERAGLGPDDVYFDVGYEKGCIVLKPMEVEEKIPVEAIERFEAKVLKELPKYRHYRSANELIQALHKKRKNR